MNLSAAAAATLLAIELLGACAGPLLAPEGRKHVCRVVVDSKFESPTFHPSPLSNPAGGLSGAAAGALAGLTAVPNIWAWIVTVPAGAAVGVVGGTACALANESHPTANADFERILNAVDAGALARGLEADLNVRRAECAPSAPGASAVPRPDTIIEIDQLDVTMGCAFGSQEYRVVAKWRMLNATTGKELVATATHCMLTSFRDVDAWFADPEASRAEIEHVLDRVGRWTAKRVLASGPISDCRFRSTESGTIEDR